MCFSSVNGAWPIQMPGQQPTPRWPRDSEAVKAVAASFAQSTAEQLKQWIYTGELQPGERLNEAALALRMGTSRGPVREAIRILSGLGLVTMSGRTLPAPIMGCMLLVVSNTMSTSPDISACIAGALPL